jgi:hypothetical protein
VLPTIENQEEKHIKPESNKGKYWFESEGRYGRAESGNSKTASVNTSRLLKEKRIVKSLGRLRIY